MDAGRKLRLQFPQAEISERIKSAPYTKTADSNGKQMVRASVKTTRRAIWMRVCRDRGEALPRQGVCCDQGVARSPIECVATEHAGYDDQPLARSARDAV